MKITRHVFLIAAGVSFVFGIAQCFRWDWAPFAALNFIPAFLCLAAWAFYRRGFLVYPLVRVLFLLVFGVWLIVFALVERFISSIAPVTNPGKYLKVIEEYWGGFSDPLVNHFPRQIPAEAKDVRFYFSPGFGQGWAILKLRCGLPSGSLEKARARLLAEKPGIKKVSDDGDRLGRDWIFAANQLDNSPDIESLPSDIEIIRFTPPPNQSHGGESGAVISKKLGVIVYWAESR